MHCYGEYLSKYQDASRLIAILALPNHWQARGTKTLKGPGCCQFNSTDCSLRSVGNLLYQRHQSFTIRHYTILFNNRYERRSFSRIPLGAPSRFARRKYTTKRRLVRACIPEMGRALVFDRPSYTIINLPRRAVESYIRLCRWDPCCCSSHRILLRHLYLYTLDHTSRLWVQACIDSKLHSCKQQISELVIAVAVKPVRQHTAPQALASTVGPLIEVPVLLGLVYIVKWIGNKRRWAP